MFSASFNILVHNICKLAPVTNSESIYSIVLPQNYGVQTLESNKTGLIFPLIDGPRAFENAWFIQSYRD